MSLQNKTIIITGSSRGVGADTAQILAAQGANVIVNYRSKAPRATKVVAAIEEAGGKAVAVQGDVTKAEDAAALVEAAIENFGSLDYLILNASGGMEAGMPDDYAMVLNRDSQLRLARLAAEKMPEGGRIVFVTSHQAHFIRDVETMPEYKPVAESKRAGEDALPAPRGFRHKAVTPFAPGPHGQVRCGFYTRGTHEIVHVPDCIVEAPGARRILNEVARAAEACGVPAYDEDARRGLDAYALVFDNMLMGLQSVIDPEVVVVGGGISARKELFEAFERMMCYR